MRQAEWQDLALGEGGRIGFRTSQTKYVLFTFSFTLFFLRIIRQAVTIKTEFQYFGNNLKQHN